jgi:hypothetical protein
MPPQFRKHGDRLKSIPVNDWNAFVATAIDHEAGKLSTTEKRERVHKDAGIFPLANGSSSAIELFSVVGLEGLPFRDISSLVDRVRFKSGTINPDRVAVNSQPLRGESGSPAVYDGLTPCRIKLNRDSSVIHTRATPVSDETYMLADEVGLYDVLWHSDKTAADAEVTAEQGDLVYAIVRIGRPVRDWHSVVLDYTSDLAEPIDVGSGNFIYSGNVADTVYGSLYGSTISAPCWIIFAGGVLDMVFWESDLKLDGYFVGFHEEDDEMRPVIVVPENPVKKLFGKWTSSPGDTGTVEIYVDRSTALGTYSVTAGATKMGNVSATDAWVYVEYEPHESLGRAWEVTAEACPDA